MSHTYAVLHVSKRTHDEIKKLLAESGYDNQFHADDIIDMHGIGLQPIPEKPHRLRLATDEDTDRE